MFLLLWTRNFQRPGRQVPRGADLQVDPPVNDAIRFVVKGAEGLVGGDDRHGDRVGRIAAEERDQDIPGAFGERILRTVRSCSLPSPRKGPSRSRSPARHAGGAAGPPRYPSNRSGNGSGTPAASLPGRGPPGGASASTRTAQAQTSTAIQRTPHRINCSRESYQDCLLFTPSRIRDM